MRANHLPSLAAAVAGALLTVAAAAPCQASASETISGFNGLAWGASYAEVEQALGPTPRSEVLESGITVLVFADSVAGENSVAMYAMLNSLGMVKGQHTVRLDPEADCVAVYRRLRDHVMLSYPLIKPAERLASDSSLGFCDAQRAGEASWVTQWEDERTGSVATVVLETGSDVIKVVYESAQFLDWLAARQ
jgi:hypothetical protein